MKKVVLEVKINENLNSLEKKICYKNKCLELGYKGLKEINLTWVILIKFKKLKKRRVNLGIYKIRENIEFALVLVAALYQYRLYIICVICSVI